MRIVAPILEHIYNICFAQGKFPNAIQLAIVSAISNDDNSKEMYASSDSKGTEKFITDRITAFCNKHNILTNSQF